MNAKQNIYFASDLHLGAPSWEESLLRERRFVQWLESIRDQAAELFLVGDIFDFWFEYRRAVPRGYVRILGKLAELADTGTTIHLFTGNHDLWYREYFPAEIGAQVHDRPVRRELHGRQFYIAHGDGLGPGDKGYKLMKKVFTFPLSIWAYRLLHPDVGIWLASYFSSRSRDYQREIDNSFLGENEFLIAHSREVLAASPEVDYFVFGHRHILRDEEIQPGKHTLFLGDWINFFSYLEVSPEAVSLRQFTSEGNPVQVSRKDEKSRV